MQDRPFERGARRRAVVAAWVAIVVAAPHVRADAPPSTPSTPAAPTTPAAPATPAPPTTPPTPAAPATAPTPATPAAASRIAFLNVTAIDVPLGLVTRLAHEAHKVFADKVPTVDRAAIAARTEEHDACKNDRACLLAFARSLGATHAWLAVVRKVKGGYSAEVELVPVDGGAAPPKEKRPAPNVIGLSRAITDASGPLVTALIPPPPAPVALPAPATAPSPAPAAPAAPPDAPRRPRTDRPKLAVLDLRDQGVGAAVATNLTDVVTSALGQLGVFDVLSRAEIEQMLAFETRKQLLGCDTGGECLAEIGGALGVAHLVSGAVGKVGDTWFLTLNLTDSATARVMAREHRQIVGDSALVEQTRGATRFVVRDLLKGMEGFLVVRASEAGAEVELDGRLVGVTPLGRLRTYGGPHTLRLSRKGFISWARDVDVRTEQTTVVEAQLVPSPEFIAQYDANAGTFRTWAFVSGGVGIAALVGGLALVANNRGRLPGYEASLLAANCQTGAAGAPRQPCGTFHTTYDDIIRTEYAAQGTAGLGLALTALGTALFFSGPPPGAYDEFKLAATPPAE